MAGCVTYWLRTSVMCILRPGDSAALGARPWQAAIKKSRLQADLHFLITGGATYQGWDGKYFSLKYFVEIRDKSKFWGRWTNPDENLKCEKIALQIFYDFATHWSDWVTQPRLIVRARIGSCCNNYRPQSQLQHSSSLPPSGSELLIFLNIFCEVSCFSFMLIFPRIKNTLKSEPIMLIRKQQSEL